MKFGPIPDLNFFIMIRCSENIREQQSSQKNVYQNEIKCFIWNLFVAFTLKNICWKNNAFFSFAAF